MQFLYLVGATDYEEINCKFISGNTQVDSHQTLHNVLSQVLLFPFIFKNATV